MSTKLTPPQILCASLIQQVRAAPAVPTAWLTVSDVMAHIQIESGFQPAVKASDYATTGSVGLLQPTRVTAASILMLYAKEIKASGLPVKSDMTDPLSNIVVGMLTLYDLKGPLGRRFGNPLSYCHLAVGFNAGQAAAERLSYAQACAFPYYIKWASVHPTYEFLDAPSKMVAA